MYAHLWGESNTNSTNEMRPFSEEGDQKTEYQGVTTVQSMRWDISACGYISSK